MLGEQIKSLVARVCKLSRRLSDYIDPPPLDPDLDMPWTFDQSLPEPAELDAEQTEEAEETQVTSNYGLPCEVSADGVLQAIFVDCAGTLFNCLFQEHVAVFVTRLSEELGFPVIVWMSGDEPELFKRLLSAEYQAWPVVRKLGGKHPERVAVMIDDYNQPGAEFICGFRAERFIPVKGIPKNA